MKRPPRWAAILAVGALAACETANVSQWRDPNYKSEGVHRVLVVGNDSTWQARLNYENAIAEAFARKGFEVSTASAIAAPDEAAKEKVDAYVKDKNVDLVVAAGPFYTYTPEGKPPLLGGYPAAYVTGDTKVYAAKSNPESPIWMASFKTYNAADDEAAATSVAAMIVYDLIKAGILVR